MVGNTKISMKTSRTALWLGSSLLVLTTGEPSPKPAEHALNKWTLVAAMPITNLSGIALLAG